VLPFELGSETGPFVRVGQTVPKGHAIRRAGEVCHAGEMLLSQGARLNPAALGLLAAQGTSSVWTFRQPRMALVVTGTEVVAPGEVPPPGKLRDTHSIALQAEAQKWGFQLQFLGRAPDEPERLRELFCWGLEFDVLLTTGGVSRGTHDLVEPVFTELGVKAKITGLAIQPGKPFFAGQGPRGNWIFGLPGNPVSALVLFTLFVLPALDRLQGGCRKFWSEVQQASAAVALPAGKEREVFLPAWLEDGWVTPLPLKGSHDLVTFARANSLLRRPIHAPPVPVGEAVEVMRL
jgi:molybdopterin molybdotransferase